MNKYLKHTWTFLFFILSALIGWCTAKLEVPMPIPLLMCIVLWYVVYVIYEEGKKIIKENK
jgi:uncharacterized membrane protein AbrB (regulator of aidB expression)